MLGSLGTFNMFICRILTDWLTKRKLLLQLVTGPTTKWPDYKALAFRMQNEKSP